jgi:cytochrome c oxidase subunit 2
LGVARTAWALPKEQIFRQVHTGSFWFPEEGSATAMATDDLFDIILWISIFFMVLITGMLLTFVVKYRRREGVQAERTATHQTSLELLWTIIPSILAVFIFYFGISTYIDIRTPPTDATEVQVTGQKWNWMFTYPNGLVSPDLHVAAGEPTRLLMRSEDVIHSMYIPAMRAKMDVVPGKYSKMWFTPTKPGQHQIFCAEYCGAGHSAMLAQLYVHSPEDYAKWLADEEEKSMNKPPVALGADLYKTRGCAQCHSLDGSRGIGPSFKGLYGKTEHLEGGATVVVDENYIHESIIEPMAKVVAGYAPVMPTFKGKLKDREINGLIEYIKTLK